MEERVGHLWEYLDVVGKEKQLAEIEKTIADPDFWNNPDEHEAVMRKRSVLESAVKKARSCKSALEDLEAWLELAEEGEDVEDEIASGLKSLEAKVEATELEALLSGPHDHSNAFVTIHSGAGGTESQDWAEMLSRMYLRWCEQSGYKTEVIDYQPGEEAGIKSITFLAKGDLAYGYLSAEIGVHRLVRISPFDAGARRHTSFASVFVSPEIEEDIEIDIDEKDLRIDTYRSSGAGGQHVNVTDSAVRITHEPSGIVVQCQNERSQHRNKDMAMKMLKSKLFELEMEKKRQELDKLEQSKSDIAWGSQIRSYVLHPYRMVKDHRTKVEIGNVDAVLDGDLDRLIQPYLKQRGRERAKKEVTN
ncbi:MAG TPA: peptide chain release factor 2 [Acidobacteriota bacterium]|nr:peptide chain release factor 2 [Acidobacteriota bacterium]